MNSSLWTRKSVVAEVLEPVVVSFFLELDNGEEGRASNMLAIGHTWEDAGVSTLPVMRFFIFLTCGLATILEASSKSFFLNMPLGCQYLRASLLVFTLHDWKFQRRSLLVKLEYLPPLKYSFITSSSNRVLSKMINVSGFPALIGVFHEITSGNSFRWRICINCRCIFTIVAVRGARGKEGEIMK